MKFLPRRVEATELKLFFTFIYLLVNDFIAKIHCGNTKSNGNGWFRSVSTICDYHFWDQRVVNIYRSLRHLSTRLSVIRKAWARILASSDLYFFIHFYRRPRATLITEKKSFAIRSLRNRSWVDILSKRIFFLICFFSCGYFLIYHW